jgi:flagellar biosynthesis repressor protein FlbT
MRYPDDGSERRQLPPQRMDEVMPLRIKLKPHEKVIIGTAVVSNGKGSCELVIENNVPLLRQKDVLTADQADSPCKRIYLALQLMYVDPKGLATHRRTYLKLIKDVLEAAPSTRQMIEPMNDAVSSGEYFAALKVAKKLIAYEQEVIDHVRRKSGL